MTEMRQQNRVAKLATPLGPDVLVLTEVQVVEGLSELFEVSIEAVSAQEDIDFNQIIGQACTVWFEQFNGADRHFCGIATAAEWVGKNKDLYVYRLTLRPWLWLLGRVSDCRIFHRQRVDAIIREVFSRRGFSDFRFAITKSYPTIEYCVQYRETDLNFVQRLMEHFGIYYFFEHTAAKHELVLCDSHSSHRPVPGLATVEYYPQEWQSRHDRQWLSYWTSGRHLESGIVTLNDYNFETPSADLKAEKAMPEGYSHGSMELYEYPGAYPIRGEGEEIAKVRVEAEQARDRRRSASGSAVSLLPGGLVTLGEHPRSSENIEYLVVRCRHSYRAQQYRSGSDPGASPYSGAYEFQASSRPFRAPLITPKPVINGPQTAVVTGQEGEEIDVDKYGRILVRFHWDREKGRSCRVRVAQVWSSKSWGGQIIPRVGQEVIVEFLEGDPDRPLVTGAVYNADNMPPYAMPDQKTMSGIKSNSTKGGGGYNEIMLDDKKGSELVRMHAEKKHEVVIRHSESVKIGETFAPPMGAASRKHVIEKGDDSLQIAVGSQDVKVAMNQSTTVGMSRDATITLSDKVAAGATIELKSGALTSITAGAAIELKAAATITLTAPIITINGPLIVNGKPLG